MSPTLPQIYDCLDVFGASERVQDTWMDSGYQASSYDIKLSNDNDICAFNGFHTLMKLALQFLVSINMQLSCSGILWYHRFNIFQYL